MMKHKTQKINNFVAKHAQRTGTGAHRPKKGVKASRVRQKRAWKKDISKFF